MGLSKVTINVGSSGLGRRPLNKDKISGLLFFDNTLPAGFGANDRVKKVYSLAEAESLGILEGSADHDVHWYHIYEYFRMNPDGELWIGYYAVPAGDYTFAEVGTMLTSTNGEIRQLGVYAEANAWDSTDVTVIQAIVDGLDDAYKQVSVLYACNMTSIVAVTGWNSVSDLRALTANKVSVVIAESASGKGLVLATAKAYSITALGTALGCISKASVAQSIGNPSAFNISNGSENETLALANGDLISALSLTVLGALKDKGYLIGRKYEPDLSGSYFERVPTSIAVTNDFAWLETNRTVDKAIRLVRTKMIPELQANVGINEDGTIRSDSVGYFQDLGQEAIEAMVAAGELSAGKALVDPNQDVGGTSQLVISLALIPIGIAEEIIVNIGLTTNL